MYKYKGKYKKCRSCIHVIEVRSVISEVKESCPHRVKYVYMWIVTKKKCESCYYHKTE